MELTPHALVEKPRRSRRVKREPAGEIPHARLHGSRGRDGAQALQHGYLSYAALADRVGRGMVGVGLHRFRREERATHVEGDEDPRRHEALPALSRNLLDDATGHDEHQAVVSPLRAGRTAGLEESKAPVELIARERGLVPEEIVPGQSALVREKIPRCQGRRGDAVSQRKVGKVPAHGSVERDPALVRKERDRRCRERLRAGAEQGRACRA